MESLAWMFIGEVVPGERRERVGVGTGNLDHPRTPGGKQPTHPTIKDTPRVRYPVLADPNFRLGAEDLG